jgi:hypothetical protein
MFQIVLALILIPLSSSTILAIAVLGTPPSAIVSAMIQSLISGVIFRGGLLLRQTVRPFLKA